MDLFQFSGPSTGFGLSVVAGIFPFFPKHSHTVPSVPWNPDTCARSCFLYKLCSHC